MEQAEWEWAVPILAVAVGWVVVWTAALFVVSLTGWLWLARAYRQKVPFAGPRLRFRSGRVGLGGYSQALRVGADPQRLHLSVFPCFRVGHPPLHVPWEDITAERRRFIFDSLVLRLRRSSVAVRLWGEDLEPFLAAGSGGRFRLDPPQGAFRGRPPVSIRTAQRLTLAFVVGAVVLMLGGAATMAGAAWMLMASIRGSAPYRDALRELRAHPAARATLGEPIQEGWMVSGGIQTGDAGGTATLAIPVHGPRGEAMLHAEAVQRDERWTTTGLWLSTGQGPPLNLLTTPSPSPSPPPTARVSRRSR